MPLAEGGELGVQREKLNDLDLLREEQEVIITTACTGRSVPVCLESLDTHITDHLFPTKRLPELCGVHK